MMCVGSIYSKVGSAIMADNMAVGLIVAQIIRKCLSKAINLKF
jgi:hypothetical protein